MPAIKNDHDVITQQLNGPYIIDFTRGFIKSAQTVAYAHVYKFYMQNKATNVSKIVKIV